MRGKHVKGLCGEGGLEREERGETQAALQDGLVNGEGEGG